MQTPWLNFTVKEMSCRCGCGRCCVDNDFMEKLISLRLELNFPFRINSGYRCSMYDRKVSNKPIRGDGPHTQGRAVDIGVYWGRAYAIVTAAAKHGLTGIGVNQKGALHSRYIHLDDIERPSPIHGPTIWTY